MSLRRVASESRWVWSIALAAVALVIVVSRLRERPPSPPPRVVEAPVVREVAPVAPVEPPHVKRVFQPDPFVRDGQCPGTVGTQQAEGRGRIRATDRTNVTLVSEMAQPDGGVAVVISADGPIDVGGRRVCTDAHGMVVARLDRAGALVWARFLEAVPWKVVAASDEDAIWIARVDMGAPAHETLPADGQPLLVVDRIALDGTYLGSRVVAVWRAGQIHDSGMHAFEGLHLAAAVAARGRLFVAGLSDSATIVDGRWQVGDDVGPDIGFVLAIPAAGPVESVVEASRYVITDMALAGDHFVTAGWCESVPIGRTGPLSYACPSARSGSVVVDGTLDAPSVRRSWPLGSDLERVHTAIDEDGSIVVAATTWQVDQLEVPVHATCSEYAYVSAWSPAGALRFSRALGDCSQRRAGADVEVSAHELEVLDVAFVGHRPVVAVRVGEELNSMRWPVRFDGARVSTPFGDSAIVLPLDARGRIVRPTIVKASGRAESTAQPDGSLALGGVENAKLVSADGRTWLAVEHVGSIEVGQRAYRVATRFESVDLTFNQACEQARLHASPYEPDVIAQVQNGDAESADEASAFHCLASVVAERAIDLVPL